MKLLILTGMSGSGKSKAIDALEDIGYYCIDNLPAEFIVNVAMQAQQSEYVNRQIAIITDSRSNFTKEKLEMLDAQLTPQSIEYKILFLDCEKEVLFKRYKESRRIHPLMIANKAVSLEEALDDERRSLTYIKERADYIIDTSYLSTSQFRQKIVDFYSNATDVDMIVNFVSFGFKYGSLMDADLVFDIRCLKNPFYIDALRHKTGLDKEVRSFVMSSDSSQGLYDRIRDYLAFSLPLYRAEGKSQIVIGLGCTGGKHRSITFAYQLFKDFKEQYNAVLSHRDIQKDV